MIPGQPGLLEQRDAEHGTRVVLAQVLVVGKFARCGGILHEDALSRAEHVLENGLWQITGRDAGVAADRPSPLH